MLLNVALQMSFKIFDIDNECFAIIHFKLSLGQSTQTNSRMTNTLIDAHCSHAPNFTYRVHQGTIDTRRIIQILLNTPPEE